ncbi:IS30 family transposase, partial [Streptococcus oralis]|uniref:IS30 family transposase n=1 Tax=Streptococcus oralis TaxID=1303 RepID=UPI001009A441
ITLETKSRKAKDVQEAVQNWFQQFPRNCFKSITFDWGKEFSNWKEISNQCDIAIFFADPGCPGQRGLNEHSNGLLRRHG